MLVLLTCVFKDVSTTTRITRSDHSTVQLCN